MICICEMRHFEKLKDLWFNGEVNLHLGCGSAGTALNIPFINLDVKEYPSWETKPHCKFVIGDARQLSFPDNHFSVVFSSDMLEHFDKSSGVQVLKESYRTLKPGGCTKIIVPDFKWAVDIYLGKIKYKDYDISGGLLAKKGGIVHGTMGPVWSVLYGDQGFNEKGYSESEHQNVWDEESLTYYLDYVGFKDIERVPDKLFTSYPDTNARDLAIEAWKE